MAGGAINSKRPLTAASLRLLAFGVWAVAPSACGQGGPPFRTDDPGTPGNRHWEVNVGLIGNRNPSEGSYSIPNLDINYGLGDRIQLKYELPLTFQETRNSGGSMIGGLGNSLLGAKYRFYERHPRSSSGDAETRFSLSVYPQLVLSSSSRSVSRGVVEPSPQFLLPVEANARVGPLRVVAETGYWFTKKEMSNSWIRGLLIGHRFRRGSELYFELYDQADVRGIDGRPKTRESTMGIGGRRPIVRSGSVLFIGMLGRSIAHVTTGNGQPLWIAYIGMQFLLGPREAARD